MNRWLFWGLILISGVALALRLPQLDQRPMHTDESVHAIKFQGLWEKGEYKYDPKEYHGPSLYYATLPLAWLSGYRNFAESRESLYRAVPVIFGVLLILLLALVADGLGRWGALWGALFTALSPAMVFYSRYYIHEMLLVCFTFLLLAAAWRYSRSQKIYWILLAGLAAGLMHATKETFVLNLAAAVPAWLLVWWFEHRLAVRQSGSVFEKAIGIGGTFGVPASGGLGAPPAEAGTPNGSSQTGSKSLGGENAARPVVSFKFQPGHFLLGALAALVVSVVLYSSFFTHAAGPLDSLRTYGPWFNRAEGKSPHVHPWYYYLQLLLWTNHGKGFIWSEGLIAVLALAGILAAGLRKGITPVQVAWLRFISLYTIFLTAGYSVIPYKTPWCFLGFWHGFILLAGVGTAVMIGLLRPLTAKVVAALVLLAATGQLASQAYRAGFVEASDPRNPYVYAHTIPDLVELVEKVKRIAAQHPSGSQMVIQVMARGSENWPLPDYWPLPWYFRGFGRVGWYASVPPEVVAPVVITSPSFAAALEKPLAGNYADAGFFGHRPGVFLQLYVQKDLWQKYLQNKPKGGD